MNANNYKTLQKEVEKLIAEGKPLKAARIMEENEHNITHKQYYNLNHLIYKSLLNKKIW